MLLIQRMRDNACPKLEIDTASLGGHIKTAGRIDRNDGCPCGILPLLAFGVKSKGDDKDATGDLVKMFNPNMVARALYSYAYVAANNVANPKIATDPQLRIDAAFHYDRFFYLLRGTGSSIAKSFFNEGLLARPGTPGAAAERQMLQIAALSSLLSVAAFGEDNVVSDYGVDFFPGRLSDIKIDRFPYPSLDASKKLLLGSFLDFALRRMTFNCGNDGCPLNAATPRSGANERIVKLANLNPAMFAKLFDSAPADVKDVWVRATTSATISGDLTGKKLEEFMKQMPNSYFAGLDACGTMSDGSAEKPVLSAIFKYGTSAQIASISAHWLSSQVANSGYHSSSKSARWKCKPISGIYREIPAAVVEKLSADDGHGNPNMTTLRILCGILHYGTAEQIGAITAEQIDQLKKNADPLSHDGAGGMGALLGAIGTGIGDGETDDVPDAKFGAIVSAIKPDASILLSLSEHIPEKFWKAISNDSAKKIFVLGDGAEVRRHVGAILDGGGLGRLPVDGELDGMALPYKMLLLHCLLVNDPFSDATRANARRVIDAFSGEQLHFAIRVAYDEASAKAAAAIRGRVEAVAWGFGYVGGAGCDNVERWPLRLAAATIFSDVTVAERFLLFDGANSNCAKAMDVDVRGAMLEAAFCWPNALVATAPNYGAVRGLRKTMTGEQIESVAVRMALHVGGAAAIKRELTVSELGGRPIFADGNAKHAVGRNKQHVLGALFSDTDVFKSYLNFRRESGPSRRGAVDSVIGRLRPDKIKDRGGLAEEFEMAVLREALRLKTALDKGEFFDYLDEDERTTAFSNVSARNASSKKGGIHDDKYGVECDLGAARAAIDRRLFVSMFKKDKLSPTPAARVGEAAFVNEMCRLAVLAMARLSPDAFFVNDGGEPKAFADLKPDTIVDLLNQSDANIRLALSMFGCKQGDDVTGGKGAIIHAMDWDTLAALAKEADSGRAFEALHDGVKASVLAWAYFGSPKDAPSDLKSRIDVLGAANLTFVLNAIDMFGANGKTPTGGGFDFRDGFCGDFKLAASDVLNKTVGSPPGFAAIADAKMLANSSSLRKPVRMAILAAALSDQQKAFGRPNWNFDAVGIDELAELFNFVDGGSVEFALMRDYYKPFGAIAISKAALIGKVDAHIFAKLQAERNSASPTINVSAGFVRAVLAKALMRKSDMFDGGVFAEKVCNAKDLVATVNAIFEGKFVHDVYGVVSATTQTAKKDAIGAIDYVIFNVLARGGLLARDAQPLLCEEARMAIALKCPCDATKKPRPDFASILGPKTVAESISYLQSKRKKINDLGVKGCACGVVYAIPDSDFSAMIKGGMLECGNHPGVDEAIYLGLCERAMFEPGFGVGPGKAFGETVDIGAGRIVNVLNGICRNCDRLDGDPTTSVGDIMKLLAGDFDLVKLLCEHRQSGVSPRLDNKLWFAIASLALFGPKYADATTFGGNSVTHGADEWHNILTDESIVELLNYLYGNAPVAIDAQFTIGGVLSEDRISSDINSLAKEEMLPALFVKGGTAGARIHRCIQNGHTPPIEGHISDALLKHMFFGSEVGELGAGDVFSALKSTNAHNGSTAPNVGPVRSFGASAAMVNSDVANALKLLVKARPVRDNSGVVDTFWRNLFDNGLLQGDVDVRAALLHYAYFDNDLVDLLSPEQIYSVWNDLWYGTRDALLCTYRFVDSTQAKRTFLDCMNRARELVMPVDVPDPENQGKTMRVKRSIFEFLLTTEPGASLFWRKMNIDEGCAKDVADLADSYGVGRASAKVTKRDTFPQASASSSTSASASSSTSASTSTSASVDTSTSASVGDSAAMFARALVKDTVHIPQFKRQNVVVLPGGKHAVDRLPEDMFGMERLGIDARVAVLAYMLGRNPDLVEQAGGKSFFDLIDERRHEGASSRIGGALMCIFSKEVQDAIAKHGTSSAAGKKDAEFIASRDLFRAGSIIHGMSPEAIVRVLENTTDDFVGGDRSDDKAKKRWIDALAALEAKLLLAVKNGAKFPSGHSMPKVFLRHPLSLARLISASFDVRRGAGAEAELEGFGAFAFVGGGGDEFRNTRDGLKSDLSEIVPTQLFAQLWRGGVFDAVGHARDKRIREDVRKAFLFSMLAEWRDYATADGVALSADDVIDALSLMNGKSEAAAEDAGFGVKKNAWKAVKFAMETYESGEFDFAKLVEHIEKSPMDQALRVQLAHCVFVYGRSKVELPQSLCILILDEAIGNENSNINDACGDDSPMGPGLILSNLSEKERGDMLAALEAVGLDLSDPDKLESEFGANAVCVQGVANSDARLGCRNIVRAMHSIASSPQRCVMLGEDGTARFVPDGCGLTTSVTDAVNFLSRPENSGTCTEVAEVIAGQKDTAVVGVILHGKGPSAPAPVFAPPPQSAAGAGSSNVTQSYVSLPSRSLIALAPQAASGNPGGGAAKSKQSASVSQRPQVDVSLLKQLCDSVGDSAIKKEVDALVVKEVMAKKPTGGGGQKQSAIDSATALKLMETVAAFRKINYNDMVSPSGTMILSGAMKRAEMGASVALYCIACVFVLIFFGFAFRKMREIAWVLFHLLLKGCDGAAIAAQGLILAQRRQSSVE
jgi:hypothetical protein